MSIADDIFAAQHALGLAEEAVLEAVGYDLSAPDIDFSFDPYDRSIEVVGAAPVDRLTARALAWLWANGFERCWLNHTDGMETYYQKGHSNDGARRTARLP